MGSSEETEPPENPYPFSVAIPDDLAIVPNHGQSGSDPLGLPGQGESYVLASQGRAEPAGIERSGVFSWHPFQS
jgi:hypothetical protein